MMSAEKTREFLYQERVVVILREKNADVVRKKAYAAHEGGLRIQEVTWTTPSAAELISEFSRRKIGTIGAGTILTVAEAKKAVAAGALFLVSPIFTPAVNAWCKKNKIVYIPGCATPNEIHAAWAAGCRPIKVFPVPDFGGSAYIKHLLAPLPFLELLPTGGLGVDDVKPYLDAGSRAVGLGAKFTHAPAVVEGDYGALTRLAQEAGAIAKGAQNRPVPVKV
jgi:2-dehydro-3-deoxyphosphogluconate aldolase/(4S)-4-hydroxy-2-oxoglutarate aldolase